MCNLSRGFGKLFSFFFSTFVGRYQPWISSHLPLTRLIIAHLKVFVNRQNTQKWEFYKQFICTKCELTNCWAGGIMEKATATPVKGAAKIPHPLPSKGWGKEQYIRYSIILAIRALPLSPSHLRTSLLLDPFASSFKLIYSIYNLYTIIGITFVLSCLYYITSLSSCQGDFLIRLDFDRGATK